MKGTTHIPRGVAPQQKYKDYLESKFNTLHETPKWAIQREPSAATDSDADSDDDELFTRAGDYTTQGKGLATELLHIKRCANLNVEQPGKVSLSAFCGRLANGTLIYLAGLR